MQKRSVFQKATVKKLSDELKLSSRATNTAKAYRKKETLVPQSSRPPRLLIIPIHVEPIHWVCGIVDIDHKRFRYHDSLLKENMRTNDVHFELFLKVYKFNSVDKSIYDGEQIGFTLFVR